MGQGCQYECIKYRNLIFMITKKLKIITLISSLYENIQGASKKVGLAYCRRLAFGLLKVHNLIINSMFFFCSRGNKQLLWGISLCGDILTLVLCETLIF